MKRMAAVSLAVALLLGGCPGGEIPPAVTIFPAGTYTGTLNCTVRVTTPAGEEVEQSSSPLTVVITEQDQLSMNDVPYYEGAAYEESSSELNAKNTLTIDSVTQNADTGTAVIAGTGTTASGELSYSTTRTITLQELSDTQLDVTDVFAGECPPDRSFELNCTGSVAR